MKNFLKIFLILFYIADIFIMFSSFCTLLKWKIAEIENKSIVLVGIVGIKQMKISLIISILIFTILTIIFIKNKKKKR